MIGLPNVQSKKGLTRLQQITLNATSNNYDDNSIHFSSSDEEQEPLNKPKVQLNMKYLNGEIKANFQTITSVRPQINQKKSDQILKKSSSSVQVNVGEIRAKSKNKILLKYGGTPSRNRINNIPVSTTYQSRKTPGMQFSRKHNKLSDKKKQQKVGSIDLFDTQNNQQKQRDVSILVLDSFEQKIIHLKPPVVQNDPRRHTEHSIPSSFIALQEELNKMNRCNSPRNRNQKTVGMGQINELRQYGVSTYEKDRKTLPTTSLTTAKQSDKSKSLLHKQSMKYSQGSYRQTILKASISQSDFKLPSKGKKKKKKAFQSTIIPTVALPQNMYKPRQLNSVRPSQVSLISKFHREASHVKPKQTKSLLVKRKELSTTHIQERSRNMAGEIAPIGQAQTQTANLFISRQSTDTVNLAQGVLQDLIITNTGGPKQQQTPERDIQQQQAEEEKTSAWNYTKKQADTWSSRSQQPILAENMFTTLSKAQGKLMLVGTSKPNAFKQQRAESLSVAMKRQYLLPNPAKQARNSSPSSEKPMRRSLLFNKQSPNKTLSQQEKAYIQPVKLLDMRTITQAIHKKQQNI